MSDMPVSANGKARWRMPSTTMTIAESTSSLKSLTILDNKDMCFTPRVNNFMTFHNDAMYQTFRKLVYKSICGKENGCKSGSDWLNVPPIRVVLNKLYPDPKNGGEAPVKYPSLYVMPQDYIYDDGTDIQLAVDSIDSLTDKNPKMAILFKTKCGESNTKNP
jgi:hypothetical protein